MSIEFKAWPKIPRGSGEKVCITEKMDGTNSCIIISDGELVGVQSRNRFITPEDDNFGFATWVQDNKEELLGLGEGYHYGEWVGCGIQKNPHNLKEKAFYLFNASRWNKNNPNLPNCCSVVPVLFAGVGDQGEIDRVMWKLKECALQEGYTPEGIIVYFCKTKRYEKYTYNHSAGKWCS